MKTSLPEIPQEELIKILKDMKTFGFSVENIAIEIAINTIQKYGAVYEFEF